MMYVKYTSRIIEEKLKYISSTGSLVSKLPLLEGWTDWAKHQLLISLANLVGFKNKQGYIDYKHQLLFSMLF